MEDEVKQALGDLRRLVNDEEFRKYFVENPHLGQPEAVVALADEVTQLLSVDLDAADDLLPALTWAAQHSNDDFALAKAARAFANTRYLQGRLDEAVSSFEAAEAGFRKLGELTELAITFTSALQSLLLTGDHIRVEAWRNEARTIFLETDDRIRLARLDFNYANVLFRRDRWEEAARSYEAAYEEFLRVGRPKDVATCLSNMAVCHISGHDSAKAAHFYERARDYCKEHGLEVLAARTDYNYAYLYYLRGEYGTSLELFEQARARCTALGDSYHPVLCSLDEAEIYLELNLTDEAIGLASEAYEGFRTLRMPYEGAKALTLWAIALGRSGKWIAALEMLEQARSTFEAEENQVYQSQVDLHSGIMYLRAGRPFEANRLAESARAGFRALDLDRKAAVAQLLVAMTHLVQRNWRQAESEVLRAIDSESETGTYSVLWQANFILGCAKQGLGELQAASEAFERAHQNLEEVRSYVRTEEQKIPLIPDKLVVYERLVGLLAESPLPRDQSRAFSFIEKAKARSLSDMVAIQATALSPRSSGRSQLATEVRRIREELNWYYRQIDLQEMRGGAQDPESLSPLQRASRTVEADLLASLRRISSSDQEFSTLQEAFTLPLDRIVSKLDKNTLLLDYYIANDLIYVALVSTLSTVVVPLTLASTATELCSSLRSHLAKFEQGREDYEAPTAQVVLAIERVLRELYAELIEPIASHLTNHLIVIPHGTLHYVPFAELLGADGPLSTSRTVTYAPSATVHTLSTERETPSGKTVLIIEQPGDSDPLSETADGRHSLSSAEDHPVPFEDAARTAAIIRVSGTARYREDNPMFSTLRLGHEELTLIDLLGLQIEAKVVALFGFSPPCRRLPNGDELVGLSRSLLYAGARSIVHTLWNPGPRAIEFFERNFFEDLSTGATTAEALTTTLSKMRASLSGPHEWAAFILIS